MNYWHERPKEIANLYNPAYLARLIERLVVAYEKEINKGIEYPLLFVATPLFLYKFYWEKLPFSTKSYLYLWVQENKELKINFELVIQDLMPLIKESLVFLLQREVLSVNKKGNLEKGTEKITQNRKSDLPEISKALKRSEFIGRWFAKSGGSENIFRIWGIRP